tara:strand:- start:604 stop:1098 length:495 start_codon:yes stop_codon:yes gene_type:complete
MNKKSLIFLTFFCTTIFYAQNLNKTQQEKDLELRNKIENSVYFHKKWMLAKIKDNSVSLKYNAYNGEMVTPEGKQIFPSNGIKLLLSNKEIWISFFRKWYHLISSENNVLLVHVPIVKYKKGSFEGVKSDFKMEHKFYRIENKRIFPLKNKEAKKLGLLEKITI